MSDMQERMAVIRECLEYKDPIGVKKLILEDKLKDDSYFWELITLLGACLTKENLEQCQGFFEVCERCMNYIINVGSVSELLLALLEQADSFDDEIKFQTFLQVIQKALLKLTSRQQFSLELSLETLSDCIKNLELPKKLDLEGEERRAHDLDPNVDKINKYVGAYLDFLKPFVAQVAVGGEVNFPGENFQRQIDCLVRCLLDILHHPLVFLDVTVSADTEIRKIRSDSRLCAEDLMSLLLKMCPKPAELIKKSVKHNDKLMREARRQRWSNQKVDNACMEQEPVPVLALSCLAYLIHHEQLAVVNYPCLYTTQGIVESNLPFVLVLMQQNESEVQRKGVLLLQTLMGMLNETSVLTYEDLDRPEYFRILDAMFDIVIHCSVKEIRQYCLQLVPVFISMFNMEAKYQIFTKLFATLKHSGAYGFCVQLFKAELEELLKASDPKVIECSQFCNTGLNRIINLMTKLSDGAATDLVENSDRIISVLNFCRYLVLRDNPNTNQTGFWNFSGEVEKEFFAQLQVGLDMSKGHYKLELTGLTDGHQSMEDEVDTSVSVAGFKLPKMESGQKMEILKQALNTLDLISSLLARVNELMDQQKKIAKT